MRDLGGRVAAGAAWAMAYKLVERGLGLISVLILARLLLPEDFGLVAVATSIVALLDILKLFGFDANLIQLRNPTKDHFDTAWTFAAILGAITGLALAALAPWVGEFYGDARLGPVLWALSLAAVVNGLESNGPVAFRRELQWRQDFLFQSTRKVASVIVTIPLALVLRNYWALVIGIIAGRLAALVMSYLITPHRPRFTVSARAELWTFSKWMLITNLLTFVRQRFGNLVIGKLTSAEAVGFFIVAYDVTKLPTAELAAPINRAAFPGFARIAHDLPRLRSGFLKLLGAVAVVVIPAGAGVSLTAEPLVRVCLGERWMPAVPAFQLLGIYGAISGLLANSQALYFAIGRPRLQALMMTVFIVVLVPAALVLTPMYAHVGAAWAYLLAGIVAVPIGLANLCYCLQLPVSRLIGVLWRPVVATGAMVAAVSALAAVLPAPVRLPEAALVLALEVPTGAMVYTAALAALWLAMGRPDGAESWLLDTLRQKLRGNAAPKRAAT